VDFSDSVVVRSLDDLADNEEERRAIGAISDNRGTATSINCIKTMRDNVARIESLVNVV